MTLTNITIMDELWTTLGKFDWTPVARTPVSHPTFAAKRHRSPLHDVQHAESQRRSAALRRGPMRPAGQLKVPLLALLVPNQHLDALDTMGAYCRDQNIRFDYMPWDPPHSIIVCRNVADQMTLKVMFPYLC